MIVVREGSATSVTVQRGECRERASDKKFPREMGGRVKAPREQQVGMPGKEGDSASGCCL